MNTYLVDGLNGSNSYSSSDYLLWIQDDTVRYNYANSPSTPSVGSSSSSAGKAAAKDELIVDTDGKTIYKVEAVGSAIHFSGSFSGTGNFIVKVLDSNQNLYNLGCVVTRFDDIMETSDPEVRS